ncbi:MAG: hypothetical protein IID45_00070 [Planctomycetes bacterium]|nr:hypothetical protein [Planctomycetota bacterium]
MDAVLSEPERPPQTSPADAPAQFPDASLLENRMPDWFRAPRVAAGFVLVFGLLFCFFSYRPVWHTDVWGHLAYGRLIWESGTIPESEPFMPLASGVPMTDTAWLSQIIGYGAHQLFGIAALQFLLAAAITACVGILAYRSYRRTGSFPLTLAGCGLFLWVEWQQLIGIRPQLAGLVCFLMLFALLTSRHWQRANWFLIPLLFAGWANLHGSFPVGLGLLAVYCVGRGCDVVRRNRRTTWSGRFFAAFRDRKVRRYFLLLELAAAAVLLNPYGVGLYTAVLQFSHSPNLSVLIEWDPLVLRMAQGQAAAAAAVILIVLYRISPRRVSFIEPLLLLGLGGAMLWTSRMIVWWAPVAVYYAVLHGSAVLRQRRTSQALPEPSPSNSLWAVVSLGMIWIFFAYTPFGFRVVHGLESTPQQSLSAQTPIAAVDYLNDNPPRGQIFNTYESGDYLVWKGPPSLQVFVTSHAHLVPREVWEDYLRIIRLDAGWETTLDRYGVNTVVLNPAVNDELAEQLRSKADWQIAYEDNRSVIFVRKKAI